MGTFLEFFFGRLQDHFHKCKVYVKGMPKDITEEDVRFYFTKYGQLTEVELMKKFLQCLFRVSCTR